MVQSRGMASYRHIEQETGSSSPQVAKRHSWYHLEGQSHKWKSMEKNRTNTSWEGDPRKKGVMAWSCHENGWSTYSEASAALGSCGIQKTWQTKDELERCKEGPPKNGINLGRGWSMSARQTFVASTCGCMYWWCWMNQVKSSHEHSVHSWRLSRTGMSSWCLKQLGLVSWQNVFWQSVPCLWTCRGERSFSKLGTQTWQNIVYSIDGVYCTCWCCRDRN